MGVQEISLFEFMYDKFTPKKIRLYQFFAGIGSQAKALKNLGVDFEDFRIVEWAVPSIKAYNLIHTKDFTDYSLGKSREEMIQVVKKVSLDYNQPITEKQLNSKSDEWVKDVYNNIIATHNLVDISSVKGKDLEIDTNYTNIIFYSFPCQDLSKAGLKAGLKKDSGTRSGLLWEVERILTELTQEERESCVLICENVPDLVEVNFVRDFSKWVLRLSELGFSSYDQVMNAKDYMIPQNRRRVFMVSLPGSYYYTFPRKMKLEYRLKDFLQKDVEEKYFLSQKIIEFYLANNEKQKMNGNGFRFGPVNENDAEVCKTILTRSGSRPDDNFLFNDDPGCQQVADLNYYNHEQSNRVYGADGISPTIRTGSDDAKAIKISSPNDESIKVIGNYSPSNHSAARVVDPTGLSPTIMENHGTITAIPIKNNNSQGYSLATDGDGIDISGRMRFHRGTVQKGMTQTLTTMGGNDVGVVVNEYAFTETEHQLFTEDGNIRRYIGSDKIDEFKEGQMATTTYPNGYGHGPRTHDESVALNTIDRPVVKHNLRIRKLTPKECLRLMGFEDDDYNSLKDTLTDSQVYHVAGDSIVVTVLMGIFGTLCGVEDYEQRIKDYTNNIIKHR